MKYLLLTLFLGATSVAQEPGPLPTLTDVQKLQLQNKYLQYENAKLRLDAAQAELLTLITSLQKPGYTFDVSSMTYAPEKEKK